MSACIMYMGSILRREKQAMRYFVIDLMRGGREDRIWSLVVRSS